MRTTLRVVQLGVAVMLATVATGGWAGTAGAAPAQPATAGTQADPPIGLDAIDQRGGPPSHSYSWTTTASNVHVYVVSAGIATTHVTFGGRAVNGPDFVGTPVGDNCEALRDLGTGQASQAAGTRQGAAKEALLVGVRVTDCTRHTDPAALVAGLDWVATHAVRPAVALVGVTVAADPAVDAAAQRVIDSGTTLVAQSGRSAGSDLEIRDASLLSPGRLPAAITVAETFGTTYDDLTRIGPAVDLFVPDSEIALSDGSSTYDLGIVADAHAGLAAGAAALLLADHPTWSPAQVQDAMVGRATPGVITGPIGASPNRLLYTGP